jgi:DNA-binding NtrC family response regulator
MMYAVFPPKMKTEARAVTQRVLLIDDDESIAGSLFHYLQMQGWDVHVAVDPVSAARQMAEYRYDVVVVDPYLTGGVLQDDGALLAMIRGHQPSAALIVLTGYGSSTLKISAERQRASAVLAKPQPVALLSQMIVDALPAHGGESFTSSPSI